jgi:hypothetical protein
MNKVQTMFNQYAKSFDHDNDGVARKHAHSFRVAKYAKEIAVSLDLSEEDIYLAELIGLLHDIGRFDQAIKYNTFNDLKSFDHGDYGAYLLFEKNMIKDFHENEKDYSVIKEAIINHNKYEIKEGLSEKELLMSKIVRDADKIDILYIVLTLNLKFDLENEDISPKVFKTFNKHKTIDNKDVQTQADHLISMLALIFDLHFEYSMKIVEERFIKPLIIRYEAEEEIEKIIYEYLKGRDMHAE